MSRSRQHLEPEMAQDAGSQVTKLQVAAAVAAATAISEGTKKTLSALGKATRWAWEKGKALPHDPEK